MVKRSKHHHIDSVLVYGLAAFSVVFLFNFQIVLTAVEKRIVPLFVQAPVIKSDTFNSDAFSHVVIRGKAYVVYDIVNQKVIAGKNENVVLPLASLTKVMTAITARNHYSGKEKISINFKSINHRYDLGLRPGQTFELNEILKYMLVFSSNDGALAIAETLGGRQKFIGVMNQDAYNLGLTLHFTHPAGLDENGQIGGLGDALSVAKLFAIGKKRYPEIFDVTTKQRVSVKSSTGKITGVPNTNQDVYDYLGIEMSKTGYTDKAGGNLGVIVNIGIGHPIVIVVLGSTKEARFADVKLLANALEKSLER